MISETLTNEKVETKFYKSQICVTCDRKIISGTDFEEILEHIQKGHKVIEDNRIGTEILSDIDRKSDMPIRKEGETESDFEQRIVDNIMRRFSFKTIDDTKEIVHYEGGMYKGGGKSIIETESEKLHPKITSHRVNEIIQRIERRTHTKRSDFDIDRSLLNLKNGLLDLNTLEFKPHSPRYLSMTQIPVNYKPEAKCPYILQFLSEILHTKDIKTILAFIALAIQGNPEYQVAFAFLGRGSNGKSTFDNLVAKFIGDSNISSMTLHQLENERFALAELYGKRLNICGDLSRREIHDTGNFKKVVTGDMLTAERKHEHPFQFRPRIILSFSTNEIPMTADQSEGYFRRWIIITFPNTFEGSRADRNILSKLTTDEELSGLLNLVIQSTMWMKRTGNIPMEQMSIEEKQVIYEQKSDPILAFCDECVRKEDGENTVKQDMYDAFMRYCDHHNLPKISIENFGRGMKRMGYDDIRISDEGRPRAWKDSKLIGFKGVENPSQSTLG